MVITTGDMFNTDPEYMYLFIALVLSYARSTPTKTRLEFRTYNDKRPLGPDKYGNYYKFNEGPHGRGWNHTSSVLLQNGDQWNNFSFKEGKQTNYHRGPFMWLDNNGQLYIVHGKKNNAWKKQLKEGKTFDGKISKPICKVTTNPGWGWESWEKHTEAYNEFLKFAHEVNFLDE